jgi:hypothetical protein
VAERPAIAIGNGWEFVESSFRGFFEPTPGSKSVANWQTQFFFGRNRHCRLPLRRQLSLPTVANSVGKLANSFCTLCLNQFAQQGSVTNFLAKRIHPQEIFLAWGDSSW